MGEKLYRIETKFNDEKYRIVYSIGDDPMSAYNKVRKYLDDKNIGIKKNREMKNICLIAENSRYPECETILFSKDFGGDDYLMKLVIRKLKNNDEVREDYILINKESKQSLKIKGKIAVFPDKIILTIPISEVDTEDIESFDKDLWKKDFRAMEGD